jgi:hypothetical protein
VEQTEITQSYKGFTICGAAAPVHNDIGLFFTEGSVLLLRSNKSVLQVDRFYDPLITCEDEDPAKWFGIFLAELAVDHCLPPLAYYLRPMDFAWAVDIPRRAAAECMRSGSSLESCCSNTNWLIRPDKSGTFEICLEFMIQELLLHKY